MDQGRLHCNATIGDGGMGEPYVLNAMMHFNTAYPAVTNYLPDLLYGNR